MGQLLTISVAEAAQRLGFPRQTTERIARDLGLMIMAGNRKRIDPNDLPEIIQGCRSKPKAHASTVAVTRVSGSSGTPGGAIAQQAHEIAEKLKGRSQGTLQRKTSAPVVPLTRAK